MQVSQAPIDLLTVVRCWLRFEVTLSRCSMIYVVFPKLLFSRLDVSILIKAFFVFGLMLNVTVNNFSVMCGRSHRFLSIASTFWG